MSVSAPLVVYVCMTLSGQEFRNTPCPPESADPPRPPLAGTINEWPPKPTEYPWHKDQWPATPGSQVFVLPRWGERHWHGHPARWNRRWVK